MHFNSNAALRRMTQLLESNVQNQGGELTDMLVVAVEEGS